MRRRAPLGMRSCVIPSGPDPVRQRRTPNRAECACLMVRFQHSHPGSAGSHAKVRIKGPRANISPRGAFGFDIRSRSSRPGSDRMSNPLHQAALPLAVTASFADVNYLLPRLPRNHRGSSEAPMRNSSTACATWRPSRIAQTTRDCPRRMSPAANTLPTEVL